jgi:hypothetical protein
VKLKIEQFSLSCLRLSYLSCAIVLLSASLVNAQSEQAPGLCAFKKTIVIGASISAETLLHLDRKSRAFIKAANFFGGGVSSLSSIGMNKTYGKSPIRFLTEDLGAGEIILNTAARFTLPLGTDQLSTLPENDAFKDATAIVGIDAFYWNAAYAKYRSPDSDRSTCDDDELNQIRYFLWMAASKHQTVVLGNVPHEDANKIAYLQTRLGRFMMKDTPDPECADKINSLLKSDCLTTNSCYIVDMDARVQNLLAGNLEEYNGKKFSYYDIRPDGIHVSPVGSKLIANEILKLLADHPPFCDQPNSSAN